MKSIYFQLQQLENSTRKAALCTIVSTKGSTPRKTGAKMLVYEDGTIFGTIGGGALEKKVTEQAVEVISTSTGIVVTHHLLNQLGMCCGGSVDVFIEPIMNKKKVYIFGAGHIGKALAKFADDLDFNVTLIDERSDEFTDLDLPNCTFVPQHHALAIDQLSFDEHTYVVVLTHDHAYDREIVVLTSKKPNGYIGMVGSQRKVEIAKKMMTSDVLLSEEQIEKINMPIGLSMKAVTPEEIAISILAKLIEVRNQENEN